MTSRNSNQRDIIELLDKLCRSIVGPAKQRDVLRQVTQYIATSPMALSSTLPYDEVCLVAKITNHLSNNRTQNDVALFSNIHEQLKTCQIDHRQRNALMTFLLFLADSPTTIHSNGFTDPSTALKSQTRVLDSLKLDGTQRSARNLLTNNTISSHLSDKNHFVNSRQRQLRHSASSDGNLNSKLCPTKSVQIQSQSDSSDYSARNTTKSKFTITDEPSADLNDDIVQSVIYSFTGIEGSYLKKDVISGGFKLDTKSKALNVVQAGMLLRLSELGYYHNQVQSFTDTKSGKSALGLMGQGFISALQKELTQYYGLVALLQEQLNTQRKLELQDWKAAAGDKVTLVKLLYWSSGPLKRLQWLSTIAEACQEKKGGALASTIYQFFGNGDPVVKAIVKHLLIAVCGPLHQMLSRWLLEGEIVDPHAEFFIECLPEVAQDRLWHGKYRVRNSMLPSFISTDMANKILVTGKSINFLREICQDKTSIRGRDELKSCFENNAENIFSPVADTKLHSTIDSAYLITSKKVLDIVMGPHKLSEHLQAMRRYLLLGQGDFIGILMENLKSELDKPAKDLHCYDLSAIMDAAVRSTNAQYDDPEILNHLDVILLNPFEGETGWDILSLQYTVRGPLATILETSMHNYRILFKPLWRIKHMEFLLSCKIWKDQVCNAKPLRPMSSQLNPIMYRLHLLTSEMVHFIHQMQYYILFEVIECSWAEFQEKVTQAKALDDILTAHDEFLEKIKIGAFLDEKSETFLSQMEEVYLGISRLEVWQDKFFEMCFKELQARKDLEEDVKKSEQKGEYGVTAEKRLQRDEEQKIFEQYLISCQKNIVKIGHDYEAAVRQFLLALNSNNDHNLQLLGIRLDFNEHYKKRDQRLGVPLTFEHMRMSNVFFNGNKSMTNSRYSVN